MIEALLSMCLITLLTLAGIEAFAASRRVFFKLNAAEEKDERAAAGLDRARIDIREAGRGLIHAARLGLISGISANETGFVIACLEKETLPAASLAAGDTFVPLAETDDFAAGREICLLSPDGGEAGAIAAVGEGGVKLASPLRRAYPNGDSVLLLVRKVEIFWDQDDKILRRRVDAGSAQPLVEGVAGFTCRLDSTAKTLGLAIRLDGREEAIYEATVLGKNLWLADGTGP